ncbi:MAG: HYR domain-containing protein [Bacteroidales bacterium]|nr:HYR domain-containing protein [Bacteroidales bacterium]
MKNKLLTSKYARLSLIFTFILLLTSGISDLRAQVIKSFTQRSSQYTPAKFIYNVKGDFTLVGNTNLTPVSYGDNTSNNNSMMYVDVDSDITTLNSSSANLSLSTENGANPDCSNIVYAGLYWTGRSHDGGNSPLTFSVTKSGVTVNFDKQKVLLKGPGAASYTTVTANSNDIYYPVTNHGQMYSAYVEVTDYVRQYGIGEYFVGNVALREGNGGSTGYYGGWGMIVIYENSKMNWRDVTVFDGHAYVAGNVTANYTIPVSGFNTTQSGNVNMKLGVIAGEGDRNISGDYLQIRNHANTNWVDISHAGNSTNNFFNSSIFTGGNSRNPNLLNNTGIDISMFDIPNSGNSVITNNQTSAQFRYGTTQDTYTIFMMAMSVDAYIPTPEAQTTIQSINAVPYLTGDPLVAQPGNEIEITIDVKNKGTEPIDNAKLIVPIPFASSYVSSSAQIFFTPLPTPNNVYFDPSLGANGSIVWDIGTLPLPADPNDLLGTLTYKIKVTEDCVILSNVNCDPEIIINGYMNGVGQISNTTFTNQSTMQGYQMSGGCIGEPILVPYVFSIDASSFVTANCLATPTVLEFLKCNVGSSIPITEVSGHLPSGSRFYNEYPVTGTSVEYTITIPFPATPGVSTYFAVPPGATSCYFEFTIEVVDMITSPTATSPITYCQNDIATPLTATASDPSYTLYYYSTLSGAPQLSITPSTATAGTFTYYVSEGLGGSCISPNKLPIQVIVNPLPLAPTSAVSDNSSVCFNDAGNIVLTATGGSGDILNWYTGSCAGTLIGTGNNLSIASPSVTTTYYAAWENSCGISSCANVEVTVLPELLMSLSVTAEISSFNGNDGEITVAASGGTPGYTYSLDGGAPQASNVFSGLSAGTYDITVFDSFGCSVTTQITVNNALEIIAVDDSGTINGYDGGIAVTNILVNDLLNGLPVDPLDVNLGFISSTDPNVTLVGTDVVVAPGTPAGTYYLVYEICEIANPTNCDQATVTITVTATPIIAIDDSATGINGTTGQTDVLNVFDNDLLNGDPVNPAEVILTELTPDPTGTLTLNPDGSVDVAPNTPGGTYTLTYQICEVLNPTNCDEAIVTITIIKTSDVSIVKSQIDPSNLPVGNPAGLITVAPSVITAGTKIYYFLSVLNNGPDHSINALITDMLPAGITNPEYSLNFGNSWFSWGGTRMLADFDFPGVNNILIRGDVDTDATGTFTNTGTIYSSDTFDPDLTNNESTVITTIVQSADLNLSKQAIGTSVVIGGDIVYQITITNYGPSAATNVIITDAIDPAIISGVEYSIDGGGTWLSPWTGSLNIGTLADGASYSIRIKGTIIDASPFPNVDPIPNTASVTSDVPDPDITNNEETIYTPLNEEADVSIIKTGPASVVAGESIEYTIDVTNNSNTFDALNVHVNDVINLAIISNPEYSIDGGTIWQAWTNAYVVGTMTPLSTLQLLIRGTVRSSVTADIPNTAVVESDTPDSDPTNNTSTIITLVDVVADLEIIKIQIDPAIIPIDNTILFADPYALMINPLEITAGDSIYYVLVYINHGPSDVTNSEITDLLPAGISSFMASRCQANYGGWTGSGNQGTIVAGGRCSIILRGVVEDDASGSIVNTGTITNTDGITDPDLTNNTSTVITPIRSQADLGIVKDVDNSTPYVGDDIVFTLTVTNYGPTDADNVVVTDLLPNGYTYVSHNTLSGTYDDITGIWSIANIPFPGTAILNITVTVNLPGAGVDYLNVSTITDIDQFDPEPGNDEDDEITNPINVIIANDDNGGPINGYDGAVNILNVFGNDLLNGLAVIPADLILTETLADPTGNLTLNADGSVDLAPGTPEGTYTLTYQICEIANPTNCDDAIVTITVESPAIIANDDTAGGIDGNTGANDVLNVFDNDLLNGNPVNPAEVTLTETVPEPNGYLVLNPDGTVDVAPGTPEGTYSLTYQICEIVNPTNCDDAIVTITVAAATIIANDDFAYDVNGYDGEVAVLNVFDNDLLSGSPVNPADVNLTETVADPNGYLTLNPDGTVDVAPGTPEGTYTLTYQICEIINPTNCDDAIVTVTVAATPIIANDDIDSDVNGYTGETGILNVFDNDLLNGNPVNPAEVILTETVPEPNGYLTLNPDGSVDLAPGTPEGTYVLTYQICEVLNPNNCDDADVIITVGADTIIANDDYAYNVNGFAGETAVVVVFDNDLLNGNPVNPTEVSLTETIPEDNGYLVLNPDGTVDVLPGTPAGTYYLTYQICEVLNPSNCDDAQVFVTVLATGIGAVDDDFTSTPVDCELGGIAGNVLSNDLLDAIPVDFNDVTITLTNDGGITGVTISANGDLNIPAGLAVGTYNLSYQICEVINPLNCDAADIIVTVLDSEDPTITCPADVAVNSDTGSCEATGVVIGTPTVNDNCGVNTVTGVRSDMLALSDPYPLGTTTITWTVTDYSGNFATCNQLVTVTDIELPTITCPTNVSVNTDSDNCTASGVILGTPTTDDNCTVASVTNDAPATFPIGTTTVTWTVTDGSGNIATCEQLVTVTDIELPTITCPIAVAVNTDPDNCTASGVILGTPTTDDNCTVASVTNDAPVTFPIGTTTVTWTVEDGSGNIATCEQLVTVTDIELPTITCPTDVSVNTDPDNCTASGVILGTPTTDDNCTVASVTN